VIPYAFHPEAEAELGAAASFYESRNVGFGGAFAAEVQRVVALLREYPDTGSPVRLPVRRALAHVPAANDASGQLRFPAGADAVALTQSK
jgi:hypothetical protein